ncbi:MAG: alpha/beta hydrolase [Pirellulaceae bacterium]
MYHLLRLLTVIIVSCSFFTQDIAAQEKRTSTRKSTKASSTDQALAKLGTRKVLYKKVGDISLNLWFFYPKGHATTDKRPAIVFFFGGGWNGGTPTQFTSQSQYLASRGMICIVADYRVKSRHQTSPFECVQDGKSAVRWIRSHAAEHGIDPDRLAAGGGSAGGHVAAATATVPGLDEKGEDLSVSCRPNALVLFNPVYDNGPQGYGFDRVGKEKRYREISPIDNIRQGTPPAIVFLGDKDNLIPVATARRYQKLMQDVGSQSVLHIYPGQGHGFFNIRKGGQEIFDQIMVQTDAFLTDLGYLEAR